MAEITRQMLIEDDALKAPGILTEEFQKLLAKLDDVVKKSQEYATVFSTNEATTAKLRESTAGLTEEQKVLAQAQSQIATLTAKQNDEYVGLIQTQNNLKQSLRDKIQLGDREAESINRQNSSIKELGAALNSNRIAYSALRSEAERNSEQGKRLLSTIQEQDKAFKELQHSIGKNQEEVGNYKEKIEEAIPALRIFGENGIKVGEILEGVGKAATSGFALVSAAIGLGAIAIKEFFARTEEGQLQQELLLDQAEIRWEQLKNRVATLGHQILEIGKHIAEAAEADEEAREVHRKQRFATATEDQKKLMLLEEEQYKKQREITLEREELLKEEIKRIKEKSIEVNKAALLLEVAYGRENDAAKKRLDAVLEADIILRKQNAEDVALAQKKAELFEKDIVNKKGSLGLTLEEQKQVQQTFADVRDLSTQFEMASRRRIRLIHQLTAEVQKLNEPPDYSLYEKDWETMLNAIAGLNSKEEAERKKKEADEKKDEEDLTKFYETEERKRTELELSQGEARWENFKKYKKKEEELIRERMNLEVELGRRTAQAIESYVVGQFEIEAANLEYALEMRREKYDQDIELAGNNAEAKAQIQKRYNEDEKRLQKEIAETKRKAANFEKAAAVLDITIKTIQAVAASELQAAILASNPVTAALASVALAQVPIEIAIGAAEAAAVLAKPIPSYDIGTKYHKGGPALVHPNELMALPGGQLQLTPSVPTIMPLPESTKVFTSSETTRMLAVQGLGVPERLDKTYQSSNQIVKQLQQTNQLLGKRLQTGILADGLAIVEVYKNADGLVQRIRKNVML